RERRSGSAEGCPVPGILPAAAESNRLPSAAENYSAENTLAVVCRTVGTWSSYDGRTPAYPPGSVFDSRGRRLSEGLKRNPCRPLRGHLSSGSGRPSVLGRPKIRGSRPNWHFES